MNASAIYLKLLLPTTNNRKQAHRTGYSRMSFHTADTELTFVGKLVLEGEIQCQTGLHIGAGKGSLEIGGADNPVVKDAFGIPYIPGSSLRGRLRSLLEQTLGLAVPSELVYLSKRKGQEVRIHQSDRPDDDVCVLFGRNPGRVERVSGEAIEAPTATPARLTVYDAPLLIDSITPQMRENLDDELTEVKSENAVDRITSQANPRTLERVPAGARFRFRMILDVLCQEDKPLLARVAEGLRLMEDDALGGGGSRGNGRIAFSSLTLTWRSKDYYATGAAETTLLSGAGLATLQQLTSSEDFAEKLA
jgi:CRISPR-associated protein Csm3